MPRAADKKTAAKKPTRAERRVINQAAYRSAKSTEKLVHEQEPEGRSVDFSWDLANLICDRVAGGDTLRKACRDLHVCERTVRNWILDDRGDDVNADPPVAGFASSFARAQMLQAEAWADQLLEIADTCTDDTAVRDKMRIEVRKFMMGKNSARFNDKSTVIVAGDQDKPVKHEHEASEALLEFIGALNAAASVKSRLPGGSSIVDQES